MKTSIIAILSFCIGSISLSFFATFQKMYIGAPLVLKGYFVPFFFGGTSGLFLGIWIFKLRDAKRSLQKSHDELEIRVTERTRQLTTEVEDRKQVERDRGKLIKELQKSLDEIRTLKGIIPICSFCKKIRNDKGYWDQVEVYIKHHTHVDFSHSFCPECAKKHYPEFLEGNEATNKFSYEIKPDQNLILSNCRGVSSLEYIIKCCDEVYSDPLFRRGMNDIIDLSHAYVNIDYDQVKQLGEYLKNIEKDRGECRIAVVTNDGPVFGVINCLKIFTEDSIIHIVPFKSYEEAMAWVTASYLIPENESASVLLS